MLISRNVNWLSWPLISSEGNMVAAQRIAHIGSWEIGLSNERKVNEKPVHCSDEMFRIAGYEPGTVEPSNEMFLTLVPKEEHEAIQAAVANAIATNQQYSIVHRLIRPNGEERTVQEVAQVLLDEKTGLPIKLVGTTQDITEQMEIKKQLMWKTALFEAQFNSSPDGIIIVDGEWRKVLQNQKMIDLWNLPEEIAHAVDHRLRLDWITGQVKDSKAFSEKVAYLYAHPNEISHDELDLINGKCCSGANRGTGFFSRQGAGCDLCSRDLEGKILFWNKGAERMYGWTRQEVVNRNIGRSSLHRSQKFEEA
jgi:PAS domain S-box-containing protein